MLRWKNSQASPRSDFYWGTELTEQNLSPDLGVSDKQKQPRWSLRAKLI